MSKQSGITAEYLRSILHYDPETGVLTWKERTKNISPHNRGRNVFNTTKAGKRAGYCPEGRWKVRLGKNLHFATRLIWMIVYGEWPPEEVDHINGVSSDDRLANLRLANHSENNRNKSVRSDSVSGVKGVRWEASKWRARIKVGQSHTHLGRFTNLADAIAAREKAEEIHFGEFRRK